LAGCSNQSNDTATATTTDGDGGDDDGSTATDTEEGELPTVSGTYDEVTGAAYETLNPLFNTEAGAGDAIGFALDQGYTFDAQQDVFPLHYELSTDQGQVWVFSIREDLQFSDPYGQVTASDYVYQIQELHQNPDFPTAQSTDWRSEYNITQNGELEFQVELPSSNALWPRTFEPLLYPIPQDLVQPYVEDGDVEGLRQDTELLELQFTGNLGAYTLDEWNRDSGTVYSRNEDFYAKDIPNAPDAWSNAPYFEGASTSVVREQSARLGALETGEADAASIPPSRFQEFVDKDNVNVFQIPQPFNEKITMNMRDNGWNAGPGNLFRLVPFRQAMAMAINKQNLIEGIYRGLARPHYTWQPQFSQWYPSDADFPQFGQGDMYGAEVARERAREAFEMSEFDYGFDGDTMVNPSGDQVTLDLYHIAGDETDQLMAEFIAQELGNNLGMNINVNSITGGPFVSDYAQIPQDRYVEAGTSVEYKGKTFTWEEPGAFNAGPRSVTSNEPWDLSVVYGLNTYPLNPLTNNAFFDGASASFNFCGYYPDFDARGLFERARNATSTEELQSIFTEMFVNLAREQPYIMLVFPDDIVGYNPRLDGPIENFSNGWNSPAWHFDG
jgi:peptide/nickel transport system substrate-binding protein